MLRMEIALFLLLSFLAYVYFTAQKERSALHQTFSVLLVAALANIFLDGVTVYTVNRLESVPLPLNDILHRLFLSSMVFVIYLFYQYIAILLETETGRPRRLDLIAKIFLALALIGSFFLPISYTVTKNGNYSSGPYMLVPYIAVAFYLVLCVILMTVNRKRLDKKVKGAIGIALITELAVSVLQGINHTWLISGMGISLMCLSFYLTLENPEALKAELVEQKLSMLYLKSQVNPHFLYNTLDTIRIRAQLAGDSEVAGLLMKLVEFFRMSVKVDSPTVTLDEELELSRVYMELMCLRYPELEWECDVDPELGGANVPNFILQPIVENSLLHGLKNKGYRGKVTILAKSVPEGVEISVRDNGCGFRAEVKARIDEMLSGYAKKPPKLSGSSIGILNVQKRIKLYCGKDYGLYYTENEEGGVTAHILLPLLEEDE